LKSNILTESLQRLYEYDKDFFDFSILKKEKWTELVHNAEKTFKIHFDLENNDSLKKQKIIVIPQTYWKNTECKFKCELFQAGGDWQVPILYFQCQIVSGYAFDMGSYHNSMFIFIPGKEEGNFHLIPSSKGGEWIVPDNNYYKKEIDPEPSEKNAGNL